MTQGEKFMFSLENGRLILLKTSTNEEFQDEVDKFQKEIRKITKKPIPIEKLF